MALIDYLITGIWYSICILAVGLLPYLLLAFCMQKISQSLQNSLSKGVGKKVFIYATAPGVMIHELGHVVFCILFGHRIRKVKLFSPDNDGTLGYVSHSYNPDNYFQRIGNFFIGTGPIWGGIFALYLISVILLPKGMIVFDSDISQTISSFFSGLFSLKFLFSWKTLLWLYLSFSIAAHVTLSPPDLEGASDGFILIAAGIFLGTLLFGWLGQWEILLVQIEFQLLLNLFASMVSFLLVLFLAAVLCRMCIKK